MPFDQTKEGRPIAAAIRRHIALEFKSEFKRRQQFNTNEVDTFLDSMPARLRTDAVAKVAKLEDAWTGDQKLAQAKDRLSAAEKVLDRTRSIIQEKAKLEAARTIQDSKIRNKALKLHRAEIVRYKGEREIALGTLEPIRNKVLNIARAYRDVVGQLPKVADSAREVAEAEIVRRSKHPITNRRDSSKPVYRPPGIREVPQPRIRPGFEVEKEEPGRYEPLTSEEALPEPSVGIPPIPEYRLDPKRAAAIVKEVPKVTPLPKEVIERLLGLRASRVEPPTESGADSGQKELTEDEELALVERLFSTLVQAINGDDTPEEVQEYLAKALTHYDRSGGTVQGFVNAMIFAGLKKSRFKEPRVSFFNDPPFLNAEKALVDKVNQGLTTLDAVGVAKAFPGYLEQTRGETHDHIIRDMLRTCRKRMESALEVL